jgi:hypothetical protein
MVTHASRNSGLRNRGSGSRTIGINRDPPRPQPTGIWPQEGDPSAAPTFPLPAPTGFGDGYAVVPPAALGNAPLGAAPAAPQDVVLGANRDPARAMPAPFPPPGADVSGQRRGAEITAPLAPWDNHMPGPNSGPGGIGGDFRYPTQQVDERLLPVPHGGAAAASSGGLGAVLAGAVAPKVPYPPPRPRAAVAAAPAPSSSPWITTGMQNNDPTARFQQQMGMLDLSKLFGGR